ncbi:MAG TPA: HU family DNA-binding protein [Planctomycetota bacterium]|nr:HU family DNA-binding protein [Planctomycetota bacterium]
MNKSQLVDVVAKDIGTSRVKAEIVVGTVLAGIAKGLKRDRGVSLVGFGTFSVRHRKGRMGRNPKTGEPIRIQASRTVSFRASRALRASI